MSEEYFSHTAEDVIGFGVFYGDESNYFGKTLEDWQGAPTENVQLVLLYTCNYNGRRISYFNRKPIFSRI